MKKILFILVALAACGSDDKKTPDANMIHEVDAAPERDRQRDVSTERVTDEDGPLDPRERALDRFGEVVESAPVRGRRAGASESGEIERGDTSRPTERRE